MENAELKSHDITSYSNMAGLLAAFLMTASPTSAEPEINTPLQSSPTATVQISGYLDELNTRNALLELQSLRAQNPDARLRLEIGDTRGGTLESGFAFSDALNKMGNVDLVCQGNLHSMAANLFVSYQGGARIAGEDCTNLMLHDIVYTISTQTIGSASFVRSYVEALMVNLKVPFDMMAQATANASGMSVQSAEALFGEDCHLSPEKAATLGLVDHFENGSAMPARINAPTVEDVYDTCGTKPLSRYFVFTDWSQYEFNGVPAPE